MWRRCLAALALVQAAQGYSMGSPFTPHAHRCVVHAMCSAKPPQLPPLGALPPAEDRNILAEVAAAIECHRSSRSCAEAEPRRLAMVTVSETTFEEMVCEVVQDITSGSSAGTTWLKPLALRRCANATLAVAARGFDPTIGWVGRGASDPDADADASGGDGLGDVFLFSQLCPAAFVATAQLADVPAELSLTVRSMYDAHAASETVADGATGAPAEDSRLLRAFLRRVREQAR